MRLLNLLLLFSICLSDKVHANKATVSIPKNPELYRQSTSQGAEKIIPTLQTLRQDVNNEKLYANHVAATVINTFNIFIEPASYNDSKDRLNEGLERLVHHFRHGKINDESDETQKGLFLLFNIKQSQDKAKATSWFLFSNFNEILE